MAERAPMMHRTLLMLLACAVLVALVTARPCNSDRWPSRTKGTITLIRPLSVIIGFNGNELAFLPGAGSHNGFVPVTLLKLGVAGCRLWRLRKRGWS